MRLLPLLAGTVVGALAVLLAGRSALLLLPRPNPDTAPLLLKLQQRWALNPHRRREARLLQAGRSHEAPAQRSRLLQGQGWGQGPLAAVVLKQQALDAEALGAHARAQNLWQRLLTRHQQEPASADALYALGQRQPGLHQQLLQRWPAHPAALAAASEHTGLSSALHLARWGARWPGAQQRMVSACSTATLQLQQRQQLAQGLAELGESQDALRCLAGASPRPATSLLLAAAELHGGPQAQAAGVNRLQALIATTPDQSAAAEAVALLSQQDTPAAQAAIQRLPQRWQQSPAAAAHKALHQPHDRAALAVLRRWPADPASWELQWQRARSAALAGRWAQVEALLLAGGSSLEASMPVALQARREFWLGLSQWQLGRQAEARRRWQHLLERHPGGYYGWRAASRLTPLPSGERLSPAPPEPGTPAHWNPLESGQPRADLLWRVGQPLEAWEAWRSAKGGQRPRTSPELQAEGRLREAIGDGWTALGQLELAALRTPPGQCRLQQLIESERYRPRQTTALRAAARSTALPLSLLLGVAKQESRFQPEARSVVGAQGLLQLMPETAAEVAGRPLPAAELNDPQRNALLGGRYLSRLLQRWDGHALLAVASYNAGPNAVARWLKPTLHTIPELWVEAIPYPETRHYVKTVLGNRWSFAAPRRVRCPWSFK